ncbi:hypothetical protein CHARACLAT_016139 [Characodon lateralis]|uniref:Uncharacterized protein n=1 Tax=Characodon lateralis TaxID=208331 RepID=A0ABU7DAA6_9TELE|nr:hypothetical protein [Characodon lateralis]
MRFCINSFTPFPLGVAKQPVTAYACHGASVHISTVRSLLIHRNVSLIDGPLRDPNLGPLSNPNLHHQNHGPGPGNSKTWTYSLRNTDLEPHLWPLSCDS